MSVEFRIEQLRAQRQALQVELDLLVELQEVRDLLSDTEATRDRLAAELRATQDALVDVHRQLFPERYFSEAELEERGISISAGGVYEWDADTPQLICGLVERHLQLLHIPFVDEDLQAAESTGATR